MKVIAVENVSKKFILAHDRPKDLADAARGMFRRNHREDFWALKDVSFEVEQGEALGIIGHNGAGKSTMLKLLTRIMNPTGGRIRTRGRVSALIEVGAGFHPEMTGRENIYLNGSILGMTRQEIAAKFDEIVAFAELEKFIDTPVKRYSSGMYARLGFAVAAHVDPEILIVDEVLSVGDAAFQEKCTERMHGLRTDAKTVIFVSHNMGAIVSLCDRVAVVNEGRIHAISDPSSAVALYRELAIARTKANAPGDGSERESRSGLGSPLAVTSLEVLTEGEDWRLQCGDPLSMRVHFCAEGRLSSPRLGIHILDSTGRVVVHVSNAISGQMQDVGGLGYCDVLVDSIPLVPGLYSVVAKASDTYGTVVYDAGTPPRELLVIPSADDDSGVASIGLVHATAHWRYGSDNG